MRATLAQNGFHEPVITQKLTAHPEEQLVDIAFHVVSGPQARVGAVAVTGDPGMSVEEFRRHAHLKAGSRVDSETGDRALAGVLKVYQREERLEAEIKLESQQYSPKAKPPASAFPPTRGQSSRCWWKAPASTRNRVKRMIPIFEEGSVDDDLLNEGNRRLRDYYQRQGYFDVKVEHERQSATAGQVTIVYKVRLGPRRRVEQVSVQGNHYFDSATLKDLLSVHAADSLDHHGAYSQALVNADINALQAVYQNNGFSKVKVTPETSAGAAKAGKIAPLAVVYRIEEGQQLRVGTVRLEGNEHLDAAKLTPLMNTVAGQLLSPANLAGDRDALLTEYLSRGFDQVRVEVAQQMDDGRPKPGGCGLPHHRRPADLCAQGSPDRPALHPSGDGGQGHHAASRRPAQPDGADGYAAQSLRFRPLQRDRYGHRKPLRRRRPTRPCCCRRRRRGAGP